MNTKFLEEFYIHYSKLNKDQKLAVDTVEGPVLVIAGPGTGKTQVLAIRIANILRTTDINPSSILCLTFQDSSVLAMKERLTKFLGKDAYKVGVYTFHSFCSDIIKDFYYLFDFNADVEPISDLDKLEIFKEILEKNKLVHLQSKGDVLKFFKEIASKVSTLKKEFITPEVLLNKIEEFVIAHKSNQISETNIQRLYEFHNFYFNYLKVLQERNLIDFDDMIYKVTEAFIRYEDLVKYYQEKYLYTLVDEFQDTNNAQLQVVKAVASFEGLDANVFAVGDDDQTIFRFQGASTDNFNQFIKIFPNSQVIVLHTNYRSNQQIIDLSTNLIANNGNRLINSDLLINKNLNKEFKSFDTSYSDKAAVQVHIFDHYWHEDFWISSEIKKIVQDGYCNYSDIAIIARTNKQLYNLTKFFDKVNIPYTFRKNESVLNDVYIRKLIFLFEALSDPLKFTNDIYLWEVLSIDFLGINSQEVLMLFVESRKNKVDLFKFITQNSLLDNSFLKIKKVLLNLIEIQSYAVSEPFLKVFLKVINEFNILAFFESTSDSVNLIRKLASLYQYVNSRNRFLVNYTIKDFIKEINIMRDRDLDIMIDELGEFTGDRVNILTAHASKGLEFKVVFVYQCIENKWEKIRGRGDIIKLPLLFEQNTFEKEIDKLISEWDERRLFYVTTTRAKEKLYLTYSKKYTENDDGNLDTEEKLPSKFISEMQLSPEFIFKHDEFNYDISNSIVSTILENNSTLSNVDKSTSYNFLTNLIKDKLNLSYTALVKYQKCGYKFLLEDIYKVPTSTSVYQLFGIFVHKGISLMYKYFTRTGGLKNSYLIEIQNDLEKEIKEEYSRLVITENDASIDRLVIDLRKALNIYFSYLINRLDSNDLIKIISSEKKVKGHVHNVNIEGRIDLILKYNNDIIIIDFKATNNVPSINEFLGLNKNSDSIHLKQLLFYKILLENAINSNIGELPRKIDKLRIEYIDLSNELVDVKEIPSHGIFLYKERKNSKDYKEFDVSSIYDLLNKEIFDTYNDMKNLKFERTNDLKNCENCPFKRHCGR